MEASTLMAEIISRGSLQSVRENPWHSLADWYDGRACASALIYPTPETLAAKNEIRFLIGMYALRHEAHK